MMCVSLALSVNEFFLQTSVPEQVSSTAEDSPPLTFEDRRKQNFEAGRLELERRKKMLQEQQEKAAVSFSDSQHTSLDIFLFYCPG